MRWQKMLVSFSTQISFKCIDRASWEEDNSKDFNEHSANLNELYFDQRHLVQINILDWIRQKAAIPKSKSIFFTKSCTLSYLFSFVFLFLFSHFVVFVICAAMTSWLRLLLSRMVSAATTITASASTSTSMLFTFSLPFVFRWRTTSMSHFGFAWCALICCSYCRRRYSIALIIAQLFRRTLGPSPVSLRYLVVVVPAKTKWDEKKRWYIPSGQYLVVSSLTQCHFRLSPFRLTF